MVLTWWQVWQRQCGDRRRQASAEWMLRRADDHWLNDIGLTRNDLRRLLNRWE